MAKSFPKLLCTLYRFGGTRAPDRFTSDEAVIGIIERHDHEIGNLSRVRPSLGEISDGVFADFLSSLIESEASHFDANQRRTKKTASLLIPRHAFDVTISMPA